MFASSPEYKNMVFIITDKKFASGFLRAQRNVVPLSSVFVLFGYLCLYIFKQYSFYYTYLPLKIAHVLFLLRERFIFVLIDKDCRASRVLKLVQTVISNNVCLWRFYLTF